jgi:cyclophilin family peptidyl-prolyl cis-trans isomerase
MKRSLSLFVSTLAAVLVVSGCGKSKDTLELSSSTETTVVAIPVPDGPAFGSTPCVAADGSAKQQREFAGPPAKCIDIAKTYTAVMTTTEGVMTFTLLDDVAPLTANNFVNLARAHYFDGIYFHRVVPNFVLQAGDPGAITEAAIGSAGAGGPGYSFADELPQEGQYKFGSLAMANSGPDTNGSQFFVISGPNGETLPPQYSLFGVIADDATTTATIKAIGALGVQDGPPSKSVIIKTVTIVEK